jgi:vancomycin aglycone glucosyltransferase
VRVLLSTIGSRGDVQPLVALASQLRALGQEVCFCVPPDFREWIEGLGMEVTPIGPELRTFKIPTPPAAPAAPLSPERRRELAEASVAAQFATIARAAARCDVIVGATALQIAARSVAQKMGISYATDTGTTGGARIRRQSRAVGARPRPLQRSLWPCTQCSSRIAGPAARR